jgi:cystathionine gamma-synthase
MPGLGLSIRGAEQLLEGVGEMREVAVVDGQVPEPTWTPETEAHQGVKSRIIELLHHAAIEPSKIQATPKDVFLYPTGMGAIFHGNRSMLKYRPGTIVVSGVIFHNSYHHLIEECPHGFKHFGRFDDQGISDLEAWLESEKQEGRAVSYLIVEFPANPTLETPDIARIKRLVRNKS